jgi:hypothetical protein
VQGEGEVEGEWVDQVVGLNNVEAVIVMLGMPGGQTPYRASQVLYAVR